MLSLVKHTPFLNPIQGQSIYFERYLGKVHRKLLLSDDATRILSL